MIVFGGYYIDSGDDHKISVDATMSTNSFVFIINQEAGDVERTRIQLLVVGISKQEQLLK